VFREANIDARQLDAFAFASRKIPEYMHHRLVACPSCDLLYVSPMPSLPEMETAYHEAAFDSGEEAGCASRTYAALLRRIIPSLPDRVGALDIGTGEGSFLEELLAAGFEQVVGVEPSAAPIAAAKPEIRPLIRQGFFRAEDFGESSFSLVTCFQTIEHVPDPLEICRGAFRLLKKGGALFLVAHNRRALSAKIMGTKSPIFDIEHLQLFSPASCKRLLTEAGFANIHVGPTWNRYPLHYWLKLVPIPRDLKLRMIRGLKWARVGYLPVVLPAGNLMAVGYKTT
jgi:SAM-dependent methyltransferase